ncbi:hypothetical protein [Erwinia rhapontici]|uniref:hypothetical protein n=1 Tax=Erwinia rhapontici TaxID=55212 RepID=UPI00105FC786|nr:hypothetical protein [Erwinia rhapontici]TDT01650.1 hypothetical protein EDF84_101377 [Erwinia rhapontici]
MKLVSPTTPAIDAAFIAVTSPVYVVTRHGRSRRFLSRSSALNNLVHFMVTGAFDKAGIPTNGPSTPVLINGHMAEKRGDLTEGYWNAYHRTYRRIMKLLARQRDIQKWHLKHEQVKQQYAELLSNKPF